MIESKIIDLMISKNVICLDERELYQYGLEVLLLKITHILCILLIGILTNKFIEIVSFIVVFSLLRRNVKGFHATTKTNCLMLSITLSAGLVVFLNYYDQKTSLIFPNIVLGLSIIILIYISRLSSNIKQLLIISFIFLNICLLIIYSQFGFLKLVITYSYATTTILGLIRNTPY